MPSAFAHQITKYNPAHCDEHGRYNGSEDTESDHGPVEAAYLEAIAAFARDSGIDRLEIREPQVAGFVNFGLEAPVDGHGLAGLFPPDLTGYHDGAEVSMPVALELIRVMLRGQGAWCRLEQQNTFTVHVGWDQYVYVGTDRACEAAVARTSELGLFAQPITASPYAADLEEPEVTQAADEDFWLQVRAELAAPQTLLLEETYLGNATRWHRLTENNLDTVRAALGPRALLTIWPDLAPDVDAVLASYPEYATVDFVWEEPNGTIRHVTVDETDHRQLTALVKGAKAACFLPLALDDRHPLFHAALPDSDGVLRARW
ncbi:RNA-binding protein [Streptomyces kunmingensis]|uniref:RNA-binding protein n=1 Tax=Streptomyces kunmingensis TaxID=68225 RepID=A0ABU6CF04_9ACTN|nr:RNA-binding protein [Streptomyces kunmingensis]MEB3963293.1 RNA-binding protein [Streptomyces kunmingensis]